MFIIIIILIMKHSQLLITESLVSGGSPPPNPNPFSMAKPFSHFRKIYRVSCRDERNKTFHTALLLEEF